MDELRIVAYAVIVVACAFLYIEDSARRNSVRWIWLAFGLEHLSVLLLLAADVGDMVAWADVRWALTPFAVVAALALAAYAVDRRLERRRFQRQVDDLFDSHRHTLSGADSGDGARRRTP